MTCATNRLLLLTAVARQTRKFGPSNAGCMLAACPPAIFQARKFTELILHTAQCVQWQGGPQTGNGHVQKRSGPGHHQSDQIR